MKKESEIQRKVRIEKEIRFQINKICELLGPFIEEHQFIIHQPEIQVTSDGMHAFLVFKTNLIPEMAQYFTDLFNFDHQFPRVKIEFVITEIENGGQTVATNSQEV